ncbi:MAG: hypothetical protein QGH45_09700 [Myxococcota bacterium]|nr:hypothetical protein [Myxococcota bacterium]
MTVNRFWVLALMAPLWAACNVAPVPPPREAPENPAPSPAEVGGVPDLSVCETWAHRKSGECRDEMQYVATGAASGAQSMLSPYSLYESCLLFGGRRTAVAACVEAPDCAGLVGCTGEILQQRWDPREAPDLCQAYLRRKTGPCKGAMQEVILMLPPDQKKPAAEAAYGLYDRCLAEPTIEAAIAGCMMESCEAFAACLFEIAPPPPDKSAG